MSYLYNTVSHRQVLQLFLVSSSDLGLRCWVRRLPTLQALLAVAIGVILETRAGLVGVLLEPAFDRQAT